MLLSAIKLVRSGDEQPDRLNRAVNLRDVSPHDASGLFRPRGVTRQQLIGSLLPRFQQSLSNRHFLRLEELAIPQRLIDGAMKDKNIRQQLRRERRFRLTQLLDGGVQRGETRSEFRAIGVRDLNPDLRDAPHGISRVVGRPIGPARPARESQHKCTH